MVLNWILGGDYMLITNQKLEQGYIQSKYPSYGTWNLFSYSTFIYGQLYVVWEHEEWLIVGYTFISKKKYQ